MTGLITILLSGIFTDNFVLMKFLGICPFLGVSNKLKSASGMGIAVTLIMVISSAVTWPIQTYLLGQDYAYLQTVVFILIIATLVQITESVMKKMMPSLYSALGVYLPLITTNCAVLGVTVLNIKEGFTFAEAVINSLGAGIGFLVAMVIFAGVRGRMEETSKPSSSFQGMPITLIAASIVSMAFAGFSGVFESIFS